MIPPVLKRYIDSKSFRVYNTPGNSGNLLELFFLPGNPGNLLEIYKVSWKFSGLVCEFAHLSSISYNSCTSECISTKYLAVNQHQLILRLVISAGVN